MGKVLIFDSSTIITLALNNLLSILPLLRKRFRGHFFISQQIKKEIIDKPLQMKRFELESLMILKLIKEGVLEVMDAPVQETMKILDIGNTTFKARGEYLQLLHEGEASCLALYNLLKNSGETPVLAIDERTTRILCENPENLRKLFERKLHTDVLMKQENTSLFKGFEIIRSAELCFIAQKKKLIVLPASDKDVISALLFAVKIKGCSISFDEIEEAKALA